MDHVYKLSMKEFTRWLSTWGYSFPGIVAGNVHGISRHLSMSTHGGSAAGMEAVHCLVSEIIISIIQYEKSSSHLLNDHDVV